MKKILIPSALLLALAACASLSEKSVAVATRTDALRIESSGSAASGTLAPNIVVGGASNCVSTSKAFLDSERAVPTFAYSESASFFGSLFGLDVGSKSMTYTGAVDETAEEIAARLRALSSFIHRDSARTSE